MRKIFMVMSLSAKRGNFEVLPIYLTAENTETVHLVGTQHVWLSAKKHTDLGRIHRLPTGIHLRGTGNSLFPMAMVNFPNVIYIIITNKMETLHNTNPTRNLSQVREQDRLILTLAGIVIALICSLVLLHDTHSMERVATRLGLGEGSKIVPTDLPCRY